MQLLESRLVGLKDSGFPTSLHVLEHNPFCTGLSSVLDSHVCPKFNTSFLLQRAKPHITSECKVKLFHLLFGLTKKLVHVH